MTPRLRENPYLFVVGCPRSGTTLLRRMLDAHPELAITPETHWITRSFERGIGVTPDGVATPELVSHLFASPKFRRTGIERADLESLLRRSARVSYAEFVRGFFDLYGRLEDKALVGDKTPGYVRSLPLLHALFPKTRFVHLIRDGRDVALSALGWRRASKLASRLSTWEAHPVATAALWWERHVRSGREAGGALGPALYYELHYEALIADPAREAESLCAFLDLRFDEAMLHFHEGRERSEPGLSAKKAWLPPTPGLRDWRAEMCREDVERFEAMSGDLLEDLGYPRAVPEPVAEAQRLAADIRSTLDEDAPSREKPLAKAGRQ
jgi:Sulfotransferase family